MANNFRMGRFGGSSMFPPVIKGLIIANVIVYLLEFFLGAFTIGGGITLGDLIFRYGALWPIDHSLFYPWQVITYQYLHGGFAHIFFNMLMLWMFGIELENLWGGRKFLIFYTISGIGAALVQLFISPYLGSVGPTVGASGSIYGIFIAFALAFPDRRIMIFPLFIPIKSKYLIIILIAMDFLMGLSATSNVAHFAHLGGAAMGWLLWKYADQIGLYAWFDKVFPPKNNQSAWSGTYHNVSDNYNSSQRKEPAKVFKTDWFKKAQDSPSTTSSATTTATKFHVNGEEINQAKIDEILDKISETGYQNLTDREKAILFELSQKLK